MLRITILSLFLLYSTLTYACECIPKKLSDHQKSEIEKSECIFIGEVIRVNNSDHTFKIKVIESLDGGDKTGTIFTGMNWRYCHPYVQEKGKWLIYGKIEGEFLRVNMCGISRSFSEPDSFINIIPPPVPPASEKDYMEFKRKKVFEKWRKENKKQATIEMEKEIVALRKRRDK